MNSLSWFTTGINQLILHSRHTNISGRKGLTPDFIYIIWSVAVVLEIVIAKSLSISIFSTVYFISSMWRVVTLFVLLWVYFLNTKNCT